MSSKKKTTKSSKRPNKGKKAAPLTRADLAKELKQRGGKAPKSATKAQLKKAIAAAKAVETRNRKKDQHAKRSDAARRGWQTRLEKSPELRAWEKERKRRHRAEQELAQTIERTRTKWGSPIYRWYDGVYFEVSKLSLEQLAKMLVDMKRRGVRLFRFEREVIVGEYGPGLAGRSPSGYISSTPHFMGRLSENDLIHGNAMYKLPSLKSMRNPGIDFIRTIVIHKDEVKNLPERLRREIFARPAQTRETLVTPEEQQFYLQKGRKPTRKEITEMRKAAEEIETDDEEEEGDE